MVFVRATCASERETAASGPFSNPQGSGSNPEGRTQMPSLSSGTNDRMSVVAQEAARRSDLRQRARAALEYLRDETGESVLLAALDSNRVVTLDVVESSHLMRTVPRVGMVIPSSSAAGLAALAHLDSDGLRSFLGDTPSLELLATLDEVRCRRGHPIAVLAISAPTERMPASSHERLGHLVSRRRNKPVRLELRSLDVGMFPPTWVFRRRSLSNEPGVHLRAARSDRARRPEAGGPRLHTPTQNQLSPFS